MKAKQVLSPTWQEMEILSPAEIKARIGTGMPGEIYILHFVQFDNDSGLWKDAKLAGHAGHYVGWAFNADKRVKQHECGQGACITAAAKEAGFSWQVVEVIPGDRYLERYIKNRKHSRQFCRHCVGVSVAAENVNKLRDLYATGLMQHEVEVN